MAKVVLIFLSLCFALNILASDRDMYFKMLGRIDSAHDESDFYFVKKKAKELFDLVQNKDEYLDFRIQTISYLLEAYQLTSDYKNAAKEFVWIEQEYLKQQVALNKPVFDTESMYRLVFVYNYFHYEFATFRQQYSVAIRYALKNLDHVNNHPEYYTTTRISHKELRYTRLWQCYTQLGLSHMHTHDYQQSFVFCKKALQYGQLVDQIDSAQFQGKIWGREQAALINLIKLEMNVENPKLLDQAYASLQESKTPHANINDRLKDQLILIVKKPQVDQGIKYRSILKLRSIPKSLEDPKVILACADYYFSIFNYKALLSDLNRLSNLQVSKGLSSTIKSRMHILRAHLALAGGDYQSMDLELAKAMTFDPVKLMEPDLQNADYKYDYLRSVHQNIDCYYKAFERTDSILFLDHIIRLASSAYASVQNIRSGQHAAQDRLSTIAELASMIEIVIVSLYTLQNNSRKIDYNLALRYMEINKSYNLRNETRIKHGLLSEHKRSELDRTQSEINRLEDKIAASTFTEGSVLDSLTQLYTNRKSILTAHGGYDATRLDCREVQSKLKPEECIVEYLFSKNVITALVITRDSIRLVYLHRLEAASDGILTHLSSFFHSIDIDHHMLRAQRDSVWSEASFYLYHSLIAPLAISLYNSILIIPDGPLNRLPFVALLTRLPENFNYKTWPYWINQTKISVQQSVALWLDYNYAARSKKQKSGLVGFAPTFKNLEHNVAECEAVAELIRPVKLIKGDHALCSQLSQEAMTAQVLHIASHAHSDLNDATKSMIIASQDTLLLEDIANREFSQDLVFLSACETGHGKVIAAEGVMSLARSFFAAGARSVMSTLWKINDRISKEQVILIYNGLKEGLTKDQAIRDMQLHYIQHKDISAKFAMPYYWASYQCQGDLRPLEFKNGYLSHWWWISLLFIAMSLIGYKILKRGAMQTLLR